MTTRPITIIPIGNIDTDIIECVTRSITRTFNIATRVESNLYMARYIPNPIFGKHNATIILKYLCKELPEDFFKTLVITELDLYSPIFSCLFGEAQLGGRCALISLFRLRQEFYNLAPDHAVFLSRCEKEAIHEIAHTIGLLHCRDINCIMFPSNSIIDTDVKSSSFCIHCHKMVIENLQVLDI